MSKEQEVNHKAKHQTNPFLIKSKEPLSVKTKTKAQKFKQVLSDLFSTKTVLTDVQPAIEQHLIADIIKADALVQSTFENIEIGKAEGASDSQLIRLSAAQVNHKAEQDGTDLVQSEDTNPKYARAVPQSTVIKSSIVISREAVNDPHSDILADVLTGTDEETAETLEAELWTGIGSTGAIAELSGINTIKSDLLNSYAESLKSDAARNPSNFSVKLSGADGALGAVADNLADLIASLPVKFKRNAKFYMESTDLSAIMKVKSVDGQLIFDVTGGLLLGYPVVEVEGFRARNNDESFVNANDIRVAFGVLSEAIAVKHVAPKNGGTELIVDEFSRDGGLVLKGHKTFTGYTKINRALRLLAAKA